MMNLVNNDYWAQLKLILRVYISFPSSTEQVVMVIRREWAKTYHLCSASVDEADAPSTPSLQRDLPGT